MFVFAIICAVVFAVALLISVFGRGDDGTVAVLVAVVAFLLSAGSLIVASVSQVPTRNVGIVTAYGKPTGRTTGAGVKWHAPWQKIDDWDASGQTYAHLGDNCVWVSIAAQRKACIPVQVEYNAKAERAPENWAAYRAVDGVDGGRFGTFLARRVNPQMDAAMVSTFADFDPLGTVDAKTGDAPAPDLNKTHRDRLIQAINATLGDDINVRSVAFGTPRYDDDTTKAINAYGTKILESRNLAIDEQNAVTRARITKTDASVDQVARCLQIAEKLGKEPGLCMNPLGALATRDK